MSKIELHLGDCLEILPTLEADSVDAVITDIPYGTTQCKWDEVIPFVPMWEQVKRLTNFFVSTSRQPFTSRLVSSNLDWFKYDYCWNKVNGIRNHLNAKHQPMRVKEDIVVFYGSKPVYNPQMREGGYVSRKTKPGQSDGFGKVTAVDYGREVTSLYPLDILEIPSHDPNNSYHPTQKPVELYEYLIKTYTNEGDTVCDIAMGSGTTGVACVQTGRNFIGIEIEPKYYEIAEKRIAEAQLQMRMPI